MSRVYSAGIATAYGAAKKAGYQGTYQQFCEDQANFASNAASVARDKTAAQTAAGNAAGSATTASTAAGTAATAAGNAQSSAQAASGSASTASAEALKAEGWASGKQNGQDVPSSSPYYHNNAKYYAQQAGSSETAAARSAADAAATADGIAAAGAAQIAAIEAKGEEVIEEIPADYTELSSEVGALKSAINSLDHRVDAVEIHETVSTPADILTITDGADDIPIDNLTIAVEPVQDLHGYDDPWPAGGGKNKFDKTSLRNTNGYLNSNGEIVSHVSWRVSEYIPVTPGSQIALSGGTTDSTTCNCWYDSNKIFISSFLVKDGVYTAPNNASYICCSVIGSRLDTYQVEYNSSITSYAPYSNICQISGWDAVKVTRTGRNLWDGEYLRGAYSANGGFNSNDSYLSSKNRIAVKPNTQYYCKYEAATVLYVAEYGVDGSFLRRKTTGSAISGGQNFATSNDTYYVNFSIGGAGSQAVAPTEPISINYPSTDTEYHAVTSANAYSITFPSEAGTVYGGTLTINQDGSGELVVDRAYKQIDGTLVSSGGTASTGVKYVRCNSVFDPLAQDSADGVCDTYKCVTSPPQAGGSGVRTIDANLFIYDDAFIDVETATGILNNSPIHIAYKTISSVSYPLTASQITTLLGTNHLFADTGAIQSITYSADPKLYIDNKITQAVAAALNA